MSTYILMTKLSPEVSKKMKDRDRIGKSWMEKVKGACPDVKWVAHYALLGQYDFMDIYEAPDEETATKVSMISLAHGAMTAESWIAIPYKRIVELSKDL